MIVIDNIAFYIQKSGGVSVVWKELIQRLLERRKNVTFLNYKYPPQNMFYDELGLSEHIIYLRTICVKIQRYFPLYLFSIKKPFIFHSTYYRYSMNPYAVNITTVHDFTYEYFSKGLKKMVHTWQKYLAIRHSNYIICISENTKQDLLKFMPNIDPRKIRVIYNGVSNDYFPIKKGVSHELPFESNSYLIFVGGRSGYKNFEYSVKSLASTNYNLLIVGPSLSSQEIVFLDVNLGKDRYYCTGRISNQQLNIYYNYAFSLIYPSSYEGFGIPVIEAQKSGCPVIAYNGSSVSEIIGNTPLLLQSLTLAEMERCLEILKSQEERYRIIAFGIENAKRFSWDETYRQTMLLYKEALCQL